LPGLLPVLYLILAAASSGRAQEAPAPDNPYFVTYSHDMTEPGTLELETKTAAARPHGGSPYVALAEEMEFGVTPWWTAELYLDGQATDDQSTLFTGYRFENRFRPLRGEHLINPVLYIEYESITGADKSILEFVGHDGQSDLSESNKTAKLDRDREAELKLILSSNFKSWNLSENFIAEKDLSHAPWEFGYAVAAARPLHSVTGRVCTFCAEKFIAGAEAYGGVGDTWALTLRDTSHYIAPVFGWQLPRDMRVSLSPGFGLTRSSLDYELRIGFAIEFAHVIERLRGSGHGRVVPEGGPQPVFGGAACGKEHPEPAGVGRAHTALSQDQVLRLKASTTAGGHLPGDTSRNGNLCTLRPAVVFYGARLGPMEINVKAVHHRRTLPLWRCSHGNSPKSASDRLDECISQ